MEVNQELNDLYQNSNTFFCFLRRREGCGRRKVLRGGNKRLGFIEDDWAKVWKEHMEKIMNKENELIWRKLM